MAADFPDWIERQSLVAPTMQVVFVPTLKAGCTSVMWALAEAEGTLATDDVSELGDQSRDQSIHNPRIHGLAPLGSFDGEARRSMLSSGEWTRFCITRDPYARLLSAWLNRAFLYSTEAERFFVPADPDLPWPPADGDAPVDVGVRFRSFVRRLVALDDPSAVDAHFAPQYSLVRPDVFPYTDVVPLTELGRFGTDLDRRRPTAAGFRPVARNVSLGLAPAQVYDAETAAMVDEYYVDDFEPFGYGTRDFPVEAEPLEFSAREVALVRMLHERSDRLRELAAVTAPTRPIRDGVRRARAAVRRRRLRG